MAAELNIQIGADVNGAIAGLKQVQQQSQATFAKVAQSSAQAGTAVGNLSRIVQDAPFGFIAISNNLQPLFDDFTRLKTQTGSVGGALKSLAGSIAGPAGIGLAFAAATSLITVFSKEIFGSGESAKKAASDADKLKDAINGIYSGVAKEASNVSALIGVLQNETETRQRKLSAIKELQQIQPDVFKNLKLEGNEVVGLTGAYQNYVASLKTAIAAKIKQAQIEQLTEKLLKLQGVTLTQTEKDYQNFGNAIGDAYQKQIDGSIAGAQFADKQKKKTQEQTTEIKKLETEISNLSNDLSQLSKGVKLPEIKPPKTKAVKDKSNEIINNAKQLAKELEKAFEGQIVLPQFSETQTKAQQLAIAKKIIGDFKANKIELKIPLVVDNEKIDVPPLLGDQGVLTEAQRNAQRDGAILGLSFNEGVKKALETGAEVRPENLAFRQFSDAFEETQQSIQNISNKIADSLSSLKTEAITQFAESLGQAFATGDLKGVFKGFVDTIAGGVVSIGKQMVALGLKAVVLKNALKSLFANPAALVAAGVGLIAVGSAIKGALGKGLEGREKGGPVTGNTPYIVGERGPELFVPAVGGSIIPNNKLTSFNGRPAFATSMGGRSIVRGNDILLASARTQRSQNRVNA